MCIYWYNSFVLIKMHGKTTIKRYVIFRIIRLTDFCSSSLVRINNEQDRQCKHDVIPWRIRVNTVVMET